MGEAKRRKAINSSYGSSAIAPSEIREKNLYKKSRTKLIPDLGMQLTPDQLFPFQLRACGSASIGVDRHLGTTITGITETLCISRVGEHPLPSISFGEPYMFSIYFGERLSEKDGSQMLLELREKGLVVAPDRSQKYLTPSKLEWVLPLKF